MDVCDSESVAHPAIVSESGRATVAHHSVLVVEAFGSIEKTPPKLKVDNVKVVVYHRPSEYRATYYARSETPAGSLDASVSRIASVVGAGPGFFYLWWP